MKFYQPFSPVIYRGEMSKDFHSYVIDNIHRILDHKNNASKNLAGNIENQWQSRKVDYQIYKDFLKSHIIEYINHIINLEFEYSKLDSDKTEILFNPDENIIRTKCTENNINYNIGFDGWEGPWLNIQVANEFNPLHSHGGIISGILFLQIPKEIEEERQEYKGKYTSLHGCLKFVRNNDMIFIKSKDMGILLFPSRLQHMVYPFKSDVERITMSFNVDNILIDNKFWTIPPHFT